MPLLAGDHCPGESADSAARVRSWFPGPACHTGRHTPGVPRLERGGDVGRPLQRDSVKCPERDRPVWPRQDKIFLACLFGSETATRSVVLQLPVRHRKANIHHASQKANEADRRLRSLAWLRSFAGTGFKPHAPDSWDRSSVAVTVDPKGSARSRHWIVISISLKGTELATFYLDQISRCLGLVGRFTAAGQGSY